MIYSKSAEYAIRALIHLARMPSGTAVHSRDIAQDEHLPPGLLAKVLQNLASEGLLRSTRGPTGGFELSCDPDSIRLLDVVFVVDHGSPKHRQCAIGCGTKCSPARPCTMHEYWQGIRPLIETLLREHTLGDLVRHETARASSHPRRRN